MKFGIVFAILLISSSQLYSQSENSVAKEDLSSQYNGLIESSESFKEYKVIKKTRIRDFWGVVEDSLSLYRANISQLNNTIIGKDSEIEGLNQRIEDRDQALEEASFEQEHINFIGINFGKKVYIIINLVIIFGLLGGLIFALSKMKLSNKIAIQKRKEFTKLDGEFQEYKKSSLDKQMKLRRELQTERNKIEELKLKVTS